MPTFTSGADTYSVTAAGTYTLDFLAGDDRLNVYVDATVTAHMGLGNDLAILKAGSVSIFGAAGADRFDIYVSNAIVDGGADNDTINIRGGASQTAHGGLGDDRFNFYADGAGVSLSGDDGNDDFFGYNHQISGSIGGGLGNDYFVQFVAGTTLSGGPGNDIYRATVNGGAATFQENPGEGIDFVQVARGNDYTLPDNIENISVQGFSGSLLGSATLTGNALPNSINSHNNVETLFGLDGNDKLSAKGGNDTLHGGNGNDYLDGGTGDDTIYGDAGSDTLQGRTGNDTMQGGAGDDVYYLDSASDVVTENSGEGTDTVRVAIVAYALPANVENAIAQSGIGGVTLTGNDALANQLTGNTGNDTLYGLDGDDTLKGGAADDALNGGNGADTMYGGLGDDSYVVNNASDLIVENAGEGTDSVTVGRNIVYTMADNLENAAEDGFAGSTFGTTIIGNALDNIIQGAERSDVLSGGAGNDTIIGSYGDPYGDSITGGAGADYLAGGIGYDTYFYLSVTDSTPGAYDTIERVDSGSGLQDVIDLSAIDANTNAAGDQAFIQNDTHAPKGVAGDLWWVATAHDGGGYDFAFYGDVNGDGVADFELHGYFTNGWWDEIIF